MVHFLVPFFGLTQHYTCETVLQVAVILLFVAAEGIPLFDYTIVCSFYPIGICAFHFKNYECY